ncbi:NfeD family protein [Pleomorphomonas sp. JP5]|uniref:NfeD family protein n=1 Tax=Pleomorphomonas sp. JP5 TaxID=2942998 RepID=UPI0020440EF2|nr:NfeD family protein [Pleomorphomonas sp. JP5]MCM5556759.1 NfeD family protein [Pleomorphomonas sp. JP5]
MGLIEGLIAYLGPWSWLVLALLLAIIEVVAPGTFFIWFGAAALVVGLAAFVVAMSWQVELVLFVVLSAVAVLVGRRFYGRASNESDGFANDRLGRQVGRFAVVERAIEGGSGHIRLDDTIWRADGPDLPVGARVRITGHRDGRFLVELASAD